MMTGKCLLNFNICARFDPDGCGGVFSFTRKLLLNIFLNYLGSCLDSFASLQWVSFYIAYSAICVLLSSKFRLSFKSRSDILLRPVGLANRLIFAFQFICNFLESLTIFRHFTMTTAIVPLENLFGYQKHGKNNQRLRKQNIAKCQG